MSRGNERSGGSRREPAPERIARDEARPRRTGLAVEGPGFFVWDEVPGEARKRAAELAAATPWWMRATAARG